jgi:hypothetical protein
LHKYLTAEGERRVSVNAEGKAAHSIVRLVARWENFSLVEVELKTGRTHQIRVHLAHLGFPIAGDDKYGDFPLEQGLQKTGLGRMFLHAAKLALPHPLSGTRRWSSSRRCPMSCALSSKNWTGMKQERMAKRFELIVFDWDGTLMDSTGAIVASIKAAARRSRHRAALRRARAPHHRPRPDRCLAPCLAGPAAERYQDVALRYRQHYMARDHELLLFDGARH